MRRPGINRILGNDFVRNHLHRYHQKLESQSAAAKNAQEAHSAGDLEKLKEKRQQRHRFGIAGGGGPVVPGGEGYVGGLCWQQRSAFRTLKRRSELLRVRGHYVC